MSFSVVVSGKNKTTTIIRLSHLGQLFLLHLIFVVMYQKPVLAIRKEDLGVSFGRRDCGSLVYDGGFVPHAVLSDDNKEYKDLVINKSVPPGEAMERIDVPHSRDFWPFDNRIANMMPLSYLVEDRYHVCITTYVMLFNTTNALLAKFHKDSENDTSGFWSAGIAGFADIVDVGTTIQDGHNIIDIGKTLQNAGIRHCREQVGKSIRIEDLRSVGFIRSRSTESGEKHVGLVMAAKINRPIQTNRLSEDIIGTRFVKDADMIGKDVSMDDIGSWTQKIMDVGAPDMARQFLC